MSCQGAYFGGCCEEIVGDGVLYRTVQINARCSVGSGTKNLSWADARVSQVLSLLDTYEIPSEWSSRREIRVDIDDTALTITSDALDYQSDLRLNSTGAANDALIETAGPRPSYATADITFMRFGASKGIFRGRPYLATAYTEDRNGVTVGVDCSRLRTPPEYSIPGTYTFTFTPRLRAFSETGTRLLSFGTYAANYRHAIAWNANVIPFLTAC